MDNYTCCQEKIMRAQSLDYSKIFTLTQRKRTMMGLNIYKPKYFN